MTHINSTLMSPLSRVSSSLVGGISQSNIRKLNEKLLKLQQQASTGKKLINASDDVVASGRISSLRISIERNSVFTRNLSAIGDNLELIDASLTNMLDQMREAKSIATDALNSESIGGQLTELSGQVSQIVNQILAAANSQIGRTFLFAGGLVERRPFETVGDAVVFTGDATAATIPVDAVTMMRVTGSPSETFNVLGGVLRGEDSDGNAVDLDPRLVSSTDVRLLNGGNGITKGILTITVSSASVDVSLSDVENVGDIISKINKTASVVGVSASINSSKNGLRISGPSGKTVKITDGDNGRTARSLGIYTPTALSSAVTGSDIDPTLSIHTRLGDLRAGSGISLGGLRIVNSTPSQTFAGTVSGLSSSSTIGDLIERINSSGTYTFATLNDDGTGIDIYSRLSNARLIVSEAVASGSTASQLGLLYSASTISRVSLKNLVSGFGLTTVTGADIKITKKDGQTVLIDVDQASNVRELISLLGADSGLTASATSAGGIVIRDITSGTGEFKIENIGKSFAATELGIEGTVSGTGTLTISGSPLSFAGIEIDNVFTSLLKMKSAVESNSQRLLKLSVDRLEGNIEEVATSQAVVGWNMRAIELIEERIELEDSRLAERKAQLEEIDLAEVLSEFQFSQVVLQSALATTARAAQLTIFNFL